MNFKVDDTVEPMFDIAFTEKDKLSPYEPKDVLASTKKNVEPGISLPKPYRIMKEICCISACIHQNAAIDYSHILWTWGARSKAYLKNGAYSNDIPQNIDAVPQKVMEQAVAVSCGAWHTLCITSDKKLWAWGENEFGQLGVGDYQKRDFPTHVMDCVKTVCANEYQTFIIKEDNTLWAFGDNEFGTMLNATESCPEPMFLMKSVASVSCGAGIVAVVRLDGSLWAWGDNRQNIIFTEAKCSQCPPTLLMDEISSVSLPISDNSDFGLAITKNGDLYAFGGSRHGSITNMQVRKQQNSMPIKLMRGVVNSFAGNDYIYILDGWGRLFSLGRNDLGQCGNGKSTAPLKKPTLIMNHALQAGTGYYHGLGLQANGDLWIWGGDYGVL